MVSEAVLDVLRGRRVLVLTGAGISTDSGIPDYRGPCSPPRAPMTYQEFRSGEAARRRYWARSHAGWETMSRARPNAGHVALAVLERHGLVDAVITQNVDGLHSRAGSRRVVDLHGRIADVVCLDCGHRNDRAELQQRLTRLNPGVPRTAPVQAAPDGDATVDDTAGFRLAYCRRCGGDLKPDVVFFGENVPKERVQRCRELVDEAEALLVAGSSLTVLSGFRFVRQAHQRRLPVVIVNRGATRGDPLATVKADAGCSELLCEIVHRLTQAAATPVPQVG